MALCTAASASHLIVYSYLIKSIGLLMVWYTLRRGRNIKMVQAQRLTPAPVVLANLPGPGPTGSQTLEISVPELLSSEHWLTIESLLFGTFRGRSGSPVGIKFTSEEHSLNGVVRARTTIKVTKHAVWSDEDCLVVRQALLSCIGEASTGSEALTGQPDSVLSWASY